MKPLDGEWLRPITMRGKNEMANDLIRLYLLHRSKSIILDYSSRIVHIRKRSDNPLQGT